MTEQEIRENDQYNTDRMMREFTHSEIGKHHSLVDHIRKDSVARALAGGALFISLIDLGLGILK